jgi:RNA polymerase sigma-70 factor (ECF subfamily)
MPEHEEGPFAPVPLGSPVMSPGESSDVGVNQYWGFLRTLASLQVDFRLRGQIDLSGLVNETLFQAAEHWEQLQDLNSHKKRAWLRKALQHKIIDKIRQIRALTNPFDEAVEATHGRILTWPEVEDTLPLEELQKQEESLEVIERLAQLPKGEQVALELRYFEGWSYRQIAEYLDRSEQAVAGLLKRGLQHLREMYEQREEG